ncbi:DUF1552 domain-containing protein [bacterium]|nr:MAG: DUF1552 domain-containing protein [bacterium]
MKSSRRSFSLGAASVGASLLLGPLVSGFRREARADSAPAARRVVFFFSPNGTVPSKWRPSGTGSAFSFSPGSILEPLTAVKDDVVVCDGVDFKGFENHEAGMHGMLTGSPSGGIFGGKSVDQFLASKIGQDTRFPSLEFGVLTDVWGGGVQTRIAYEAAGKFVDPEDDPVEAYKRLFGAVAGSGDAALAARLLARKKSVLDVVRGDLGDLRSRLSAGERAKVDLHMEAIRSVERGLSGGASTCAAPIAPMAVSPNSMADMPTIGRAQTDLLLLALSCGMTRVASLQWSHTVSPVLMSWLGLGEAHHDLSHKGDEDTAGVANFVKAERWYAEQFAYLVAQMKKLPDPDGGGSLLDTSLVVWTKEMGDSRLHNAKSVPFVLAGGASGAVKTGRAMNFGGASHTLLLSSICKAAGVDTTALGADAAGLPGLVG